MRILMTVLLALAMLPATAQVTINDVTLPAQSKVGDSNLTLNGGGIRKKAFFKLYVAGLYLPKKSSEAKSLVAADDPIAIRLQITSRMISSDNMSEAIREGFGKSTGGKTAPLQDRIDSFISTFAKEEISEGNVFELKYVPGTGVETYKNGKLANTTKGLDFKQALFGIWLGDNPVDADLKKGLLGG